MDDPVYAFYSQNIETASKDQLLEALQSALQSAHFWREACLIGLTAFQQTQNTFPVTGDKHREDQL